MNQQLLGRCVGAIGALCSAAGCAMALTGFVLGLRAGGFLRILLVVLWPIALVALVVMAQSIGTLVALVRRPDPRQPMIMAGIHGVLGTFGCFFARFSFPSMWFALGILGIAASGAFAAECCADGAKTG
jgi:hypothetical protein